MRKKSTQQVATPQQKTAKNEKKNKNPWKFFISFVVILFALYFVYIIIWQQISLTRKGNQIDELQAEIEQATAQTEKLEQELENLNDPAYLEKIAREKLGLVRPNERVFVDANKSQSNTAE
ncbi:MAG: septum formation initiator family protein [Clostridia bacterium]|nr:septum formation initiator family protein [Clostridia bacterium]